jgi:hypothetical protein
LNSTRIIEPRLAARGRGQHNLDTGIPEDIGGSGKLFEPEAGLATSVAKLVVRRQNIRTVVFNLLFAITPR